MLLNLSVIRRILMVFFGYRYVIYLNMEGTELRPEAVFQRNKNLNPTKIPIGIIAASWQLRFLFKGGVESPQITTGSVFDSKGKKWDL